MVRPTTRIQRMAERRGRFQGAPAAPAPTAPQAQPMAVQQMADLARYRANMNTAPNDAGFAAPNYDYTPGQDKDPNAMRPGKFGPEPIANPAGGEVMAGAPEDPMMTTQPVGQPSPTMPGANPTRRFAEMQNRIQGMDPSKMNPQQRQFAEMQNRVAAAQQQGQPLNARQQRFMQMQNRATARGLLSRPPTI